MGSLSDFIRSAPPCNPSLPLFHTCDGYRFRSIAQEQELRTSACDVFDGENLLYFFYGRPSYRVARDTKAVSLPFFFPVAIMLKHDSVPKLKRIAPFDTGAFNRKIFSEHMHPKMRCEDFLLEPTIDMPNRLVSQFYGSNKAYFLGRPLEIKIPPIEFEAMSYHSLIHSESKAKYDDRNSSVEMQSERNLVLDSETVLLVVMPSVFLEDPELQKRILSDWDAEVRTYSIHRSNPNEYTLLIYHEIESYLEAENYL